MNPPAAVQATGLAKSFGAREAVRDVDILLRDGDCLALFGPNGAGKTTLLRLAAGLLKPTAGQIRVREVDARQDPAARGRVGLVSHHTMLYAPLTALENVEFAARLHGVAAPRSAAREALASFHLEDIADVRVAKLSRGQQQRVSIARALVHGPTLLLLDEPYAGLDHTGAAALSETLQSLKSRGAAFMIVTHNLLEGLSLATQAAIMKSGRFAHFENPRDGRFDTPTFIDKYQTLIGVGHHA